MHLSSYLIVSIIPIFSLFAILQGGLWTWGVPVFIYLILPLLELPLRGSYRNYSPEEEESRRKDWRFDALIQLLVPLQLGLLGTMLWVAPSLSGWSLLGAIITVGTSCGAIGINVGHELGHRRSKKEQLLAKIMLGTSLYAHFFIEHNRGHHARVATSEDPASAEAGSWLYPFVVRSIVGGAISAWELEQTRLQKQGKSAWSLKNEVLVLWVVQAGLVGLVWLVLGSLSMLVWLAVAFWGIFLLETINYVEHYGLRRSPTATGYERVSPAHSWTSDRPLSRVLLFDLSRHADHHAYPGRPYQVLRHTEAAPELPTGYAGMLMLALVPPLFVPLMKRQLSLQCPVS
jgi:alkane 1-monooxygenase